MQSHNTPNTAPLATLGDAARRAATILFVKAVVVFKLERTSLLRVSRAMKRSLVAHHGIQDGQELAHAVRANRNTLSRSRCCSDSLLRVGSDVFWKSYLINLLPREG